MTFSIYLSIALFTIFGSTNSKPIRQITGHITGTVHDNTPDSGLPYYGYPPGNNAAVGTPERYPTLSGLGNAGPISNGAPFKDAYGNAGRTVQGNTRNTQPRYDPTGNNAAVGTPERNPSASYVNGGPSSHGTPIKDIHGTVLGTVYVNTREHIAHGTPIKDIYGNVVGTVYVNSRDGSLTYFVYNPTGSNPGGFNDGTDTDGFSRRFFGNPERNPASRYGNVGLISNGKPIGDINENVNGDVIDNGRSCWFC